ncbi:MAG TPA: 5-formyltetrahydrofolate cyclo-ligase, partial [Bacillota bacterium]|nr:5-formyltetrahydrofolate cyclo-ligase [Bacillota bacterium]
MAKHALRKQIFALRDSLGAAEIARLSKAVAGQLEKLPFYRQARTIMFFLSFRSEVDTREMVEDNLARGN